MTAFVNDERFYTLPGTLSRIAWFDTFRVDESTYHAVEGQAQTKGSRSALVFYGDIPLVLTEVSDEAFCVIGRYNQGERYFAIPKGTLLPQNNERQ